MQKNLYSQTLWDDGYSHLQFQIAHQKDQVRMWLEKWSKGRKGSCLEIGCFPGRYLAVLGQEGFELNGIDMAPRVDQEMPQWLKEQGYRVGQTVREDFFKYEFGRKFDLVYSVGFLEHFTQWREVLIRMAGLVAEDGMLLVNTPNFAGKFQKWFHQIFDLENFERHSLEAMEPLQWKEEVERLGFRVLDFGYSDELDFWVGVQKRGIIRKLGFWALRAAKPVLARITPRRTRSFAPYCVLTAIKPKTR